MLKSKEKGLIEEYFPLVPSVRMEGLEPPRLAAPDPKSGAATNYATSALVFFSGLQRYNFFISFVNNLIFILPIGFCSLFHL